MTVGQVSFWAVVYVLVGTWIWRRDLSMATRVAALAGWTLVGSIGTAASEFACVATHYEHAPGMPGYCEGSAAGAVAFFLYPVVAIGLGVTAFVLVRQRSRKRSAPGPERR